MRTVLFFILLISLAGCRGTKFNYASDDTVKELGPLRSVHLDSTFRLYVRQIIKKYNYSTKMYDPLNAKTPDGKKVIEVEYMLLSWEKKQVLILNNIPSIYQNIGTGNRNRFNIAGGKDSLSIDIWYVRQFRFGKIKNEDSIVFKNANGTTDTHIWNIIHYPADSIKLNSISVADNLGMGEDTRNIDSAFSLPMIFKPVHNFKLFFENKTMPKTSARSFDLPDNTFYVVNKNKKWYAIFSFPVSVYPAKNDSFKNIIFTNDRMYTAPELTGQ